MIFYLWYHINMDETRNVFIEQKSRLMSPQDWGSGKSFREFPQLRSWPSEEAFQVLAWFAACPVPKKVWRYYKERGEKDIQWIIERYNSTNDLARNWFWKEAKGLNPALYAQLTSFRRRNINEKVGGKSEHTGVYEADGVPKFHDEWLSAMANLTNYSVPRMGILIAGTSKLEELIKNENAMRGIRDSIVNSVTPAECAARFANFTFQMGVPANNAIEHPMEVDKMVEENYMSQIHLVATHLLIFAPNLIGEFMRMQSPNDPVHEEAVRAILGLHIKKK